MKKAFWIIAIVLAILIGIYPLFYLVMDMSGGLLNTKGEALLNSPVWNVSFYTHIYFGGIALLIGWLQFSAKLRRNQIQLHRVVGMVYFVSVFLSGISGLYIAFYATSGWVAATGFSFLAVFWLLSSGLGFSAIKRGEVVPHQRWLTRSYGLTFAAVTLRIWLPLMTGALGMGFDEAYRIVAWLCWVPNLLVVEWLILPRLRVVA